MKFGANFHKKETRFAIHSKTKRLWLLLFDQPEDETPSREIELVRDKTHFHTTVPGIAPGTLYLYRTETGQRLLDPCARAVHTPFRWGQWKNTRPDEPHMPKAVVVSDEFDWEQDRHPKIPLERSVIYEAHLRGFTRGSSGGTYLDVIDKIPYLKELGITAIEFLPLFEFDELEYRALGDPRKELLNFWGYSTRSFFAPMSRYARSDRPGAAVTEFKTLVKALHAAHIEVILDVVFNHTGEGEKDGPIYNFRALNENAYYMHNPDGTYMNWSGCGNTVNCNHPVTRQFIVECLKTWVTKMHVDGFRFDLATTLCRNRIGNLSKRPPLLQAIEAESALKNTKLIAEAWDCGGYQVGGFPAARFSEWNGKYRDDIRRFWNAGAGIGALATRLAGSSDLYQHPRSGSPLKSINFITAHDGFTLADLVSYSQKHNEANAEDNRDGENQNDSINFGKEGPSTEAPIKRNRLKQQKNLLATLLLSQGVPMLTAGDEFARTQQGNNNAYCQDNELSWIDWNLLEQHRDLFAFTQKLIAMRARFTQLRRKTFFTGKGDVDWIGPDGAPPDWDHAHALGMILPGKKDLLILINNEQYDVAFTMDRRGSNAWKIELSSAPVSGFTLPPQSLAVYSS